MKNAFHRTIFASAVSLALAPAANADITAQELRDFMVGYYGDQGIEISIGTEEMSGGMLSLSDTTISIPVPDTDGVVVMKVPPIGLRETSDGAVLVEIPPISEYEITSTVAGETQLSTTLVQEIEDITTRFSGSIDNMRIESSATSSSYRIAEVKVAGQSIPVNFVVNTGEYGVDYTLSLAEDDRRGFSGEYSMASLGILANARDPQGEGFFSLVMNAADMAAAFSGAVKTTEDPIELLAAGIDIAVDVTTGPADIDFEFQDGESQMSLHATEETSRFGFTLSPQEIAYDVGATGVEMDFSSSDIPLPKISLSYETAESSLRVPLAKSADPSPFSLRTVLRGLSVSEVLWSMVDPTQAIPRDPATVALDVSGTAMVTADLMDPETLAQIDSMERPPILPLTVEINEITAEFGGAALSGGGSFAYDLENPAIVNGLPVPAGEVNLSLSGGFGLIDKLGQIGLIPPEAVIGIRGFVGALSRPVGEDQLETTIEVTPEGAVLANGVRIR